jgi:RNA polymerase-binding transcription factor DksA
MRRAASARRALADTDEALARLAAGRFGRCESCAAPISSQTLRAEPEARYCARCAEPALVQPRMSVVTA